MKLLVSPWDKFPKYSIEKEGITQSLLDIAMSCPRKLWFQLNRLENPQFAGVFEFGSEMHKLLDLVYSQKIKTSEAIMEWVDSHETTTAKLLPLMSAVGRAYFEHYAKEISGGKFTCEKSFDFTINNIRYRGQRDVYFTKNKTEIWIMDHKFWSQINVDELITTLPFDFQVNFYAWTFWKEHGKMPTGVILNIVRKPQNKMKEDGNPVEFEKRIYETIKEKPEYYFYRVPITINQKGMKRFEEDLMAKLDYLQYVGIKEKIYRNEFNCFSNFSCPFHDACFTQNIKLLKQHKSLFPELETETK